TTIMISTRVKPFFLVVLFFITDVSVSRREQGEGLVIISTRFVHVLPVANRVLKLNSRET
ncbi:MAG TPA: hypothetical protein VN794_19700, partial [Methylomirabilota bacterium]|nr:hypothetical protein [Methylomirabilota bacterium]